MGKMRTMVPSVLLLGMLLISGCSTAPEMAAAPESTPSPEPVTTPEPTATSEPITAPEQTVMPEPTSNGEIISGFRNWVIEKVLENYWDGDIISASDIVIDQIYYGSFSQDDVCEMLVECKILNLPHVAGLDRRVCLLMPCDSLELTAYTEFPGDNRKSFRKLRQYWFGIRIWRNMLQRPNGGIYLIKCLNES